MLFRADCTACFTIEVRTFLVNWVSLAGQPQGSVCGFWLVCLQVRTWIRLRVRVRVLVMSMNVLTLTEVQKCVCVCEDDWVTNKAITLL